MAEQHGYVLLAYLVINDGSCRKNDKAEKAEEAELLSMFHLGPKESLIGQYLGALEFRGFLFNGKLYLFTNYLCFYSSMYLSKTIRVIPFGDITEVIYSCCMEGTQRY